MRSDVIFWDVDTQVDFMTPGGKLYVPGSEEIIPVLGQLTGHAHRRGIRIIASADDHVADHRELSSTPDWQETFPEHCMRGTPGQAKIAETALRCWTAGLRRRDLFLLQSVGAHQQWLPTGHCTSSAEDGRATSP